VLNIQSCQDRREDTAILMEMSDLSPEKMSDLSVEPLSSFRFRVLPPAKKVSEPSEGQSSSPQRHCGSSNEVVAAEAAEDPERIQVCSAICELEGLSCKDTPVLLQSPSLLHSPSLPLHSIPEDALPSLEHELEIGCASGSNTPAGEPAPDSGSCPEVTRRLPSEVSERDLVRMGRVITDIVAAMADVRARMDRIEVVVPDCARHMDEVSGLVQDLSLLVQNNEQGQQHLQKQLNEVVKKCEASMTNAKHEHLLQGLEVVKSCKELLETHRTEVQISVRQGVAKEVEMLSGSIRCQISMLLEDVQKMRRNDNENSFSRTVDGWKNTWLCMQSPWCATDDGVRPGRVDDVYSDRYLETMGNGLLGCEDRCPTGHQQPGPVVLTAQPCIVLEPAGGSVGVYEREASIDYRIL